MTESQVVWWRDIPAQVKARDGSARAGRALSPRFQEAIDAAAMRSGLTDTDDYLAEWRSTAWEGSDAPPDQVVEQRAAELEAEYSQERLSALVERGGREG